MLSFHVQRARWCSHVETSMPNARKQSKRVPPAATVAGGILYARSPVKYQRLAVTPTFQGMQVAGRW